MSSNTDTLATNIFSDIYHRKCKLGDDLTFNGKMLKVVNINTVNKTMECIKLIRKSRIQFPFAKKGDVIICPNGDMFKVQVDLENHNYIYCSRCEHKNYWHSS
jgi:hypothetical protein